MTVSLTVGFSTLSALHRSRRCSARAAAAAAAATGAAASDTAIAGT